MAEFDLVIRGGTVIDGTGGPGRPADVAVREGKVVAVGEPDGSATRTIDAAGLVVCPGFVDIHTHYDAQLFWDSSASPSPLHGVTTVIGGNCGFSLAPCGPEHADYLARLMARVEGMPLAALEAGLDWSWRSFGDWLGRLDGRVGVNAGFLVGHSALRRAVMGDDAVGHRATEAQVSAMVETLQSALGRGALGFSTSQSHTHHDGAGDPVPSRAADVLEILALAEAVAPFPGTSVELIVSGCLNGFTDEEVDLLTRVSLLADRPVNWNVLGVSAAGRERTAHQLGASTRAAERGATVVALTLPQSTQVRLCFASPAILGGFPGWHEVMESAPTERLRALSDPATRRRLDEDAQSEAAGAMRGLANWPRLVIEEAFTDETKPFEGRSVAEVAAERGVDPFDALLDVVVADGLQTGLRVPMTQNDDDWKARAEVWRDPRSVVGGSDAGAHLDTMCGAVYSTAMLGEAVRERQLVSFEEAIHQLTAVPAALYGLRGRGSLAEGSWADVVVFDPERVGPGAERTRQDLPGGASRLYAGSTGIEHVIVNGTTVVRAGELTGAEPGRVLRAGADTDTVHAATGAEAILAAAR
jgi:N-acyl-D-aspartate/D-glutamate deacylase